MVNTTTIVMSSILKNLRFSKAVDLGCGEGYNGVTLKTHTSYLIGVDHNIARLNMAKGFGNYDEVILCEVQDFQIPPDTEAVFMIDLIEHLSKTEGTGLLFKIRNIPFILIATPVEFHEQTLRDHHKSLWTEKEFKENGFDTIVFSTGILLRIFTPWKNKIIAWK